MSVHNFLCTHFVEVLTFAILWLGLLIGPEPVEICRIKSYIIKLHLMSRPCILKTQALYLTSVEKVSGQNLHLLKIENCRH